MKLYSPRHIHQVTATKSRLQFDGQGGVALLEKLREREKAGADDVVVAVDNPAGTLYRLAHEDGVQVVADVLYVNGEIVGSVPHHYLKPNEFGGNPVETIDLTDEEERLILKGKGDLVNITRAQVGRTPGDDEEHAEAVTALTAGPVEDILVGTPSNAEAIALAAGEGVSTAPSITTESVPTPVQMPVAMPQDPPPQPVVGAAAATEKAKVRLSKSEKKTEKPSEPVAPASPDAEAASTDDDRSDDEIVDVGTPKVTR